MKIGFFDSGLGGLTVMKAVAALMPQYDYQFYGDTENLPYGDKSEEDIYTLTKEGIVELFKRDCLLVVIACNTASAETARKLQSEFIPNEYPDRKILGVIVPTVEKLLDLSVTRATLLATKRTVTSEKYSIELSNRSAKPPTLTALATPELVPLIELGELEAAATAAISRIETAGGESEVVILGCTHYAQIKSQLRAHFPNKIILSQDEIIPDKLQVYLEAHPEIENKLSTGGKREIHLTKHRAEYDRYMAQLLGGVYLDE